MVYQPMVDLKTMHVAGVEALLRWNHPSLGVLGPDDFLSLAEETGIFRNLSEWVLTEVCSQAKTWHDLFGSDFGVGVNLSAIQFRDLQFVADLGRVLRRTGADCGTVHFEITEQALMEDEESTLRNLDELHGLGFKVAIDDFGVGYSSLSYLRRFHVDVLKIDQSFVRDEDSERTLAIVTSVVQLAHALGMSATAEGIETEDQLQRVQQAGCDLAQGYLLSRPVAAVAITEMLSSRPASPAIAA
jgi:EAL domain-containing protein (putative c-di-GMP-specific phosphodiesterase class I)